MMGWLFDYNTAMMKWLGEKLLEGEDAVWQRVHVGGSRVRIVDGLGQRRSFQRLENRCRGNPGEHHEDGHYGEKLREREAFLVAWSFGLHKDDMAS